MKFDTEQVQFLRRPAWVFDGAKTSEEISLRKLAFGKGCKKDIFLRKLESIRKRFKEGNV